MSLEQEIGRLADVLEKIEVKMGAQIVNVDMATGTDTTVAPKKAAKKKKAAPKAAEAAQTVEVGEEDMTPEELLKHCSTNLLGITDVDKRAATIAKVKAMLKKDYGVTSIKAVPAESIAECKTAFDLLIGA